MLQPLSDLVFGDPGTVRRMVVIAAATLGLGAPAKAEVIFDNITGTSSPGGYVVGLYSPGSDYAIGWSFTVPLGAALPALGGSIGVSFLGGSGTNEMDLEIAEDDSLSTIGAVVATAVITNLPADLEIINFQLSSPVILTPGATYWLLASMPDPNATAYWWTPNIAADPGAFPQAVSYNGGSYTLGSNERPGEFSIATVPEPSTWVMTLLGFAAAAWTASPTRRRLTNIRATARLPHPCG
jgi:hypothetical protein